MKKKATYNQDLRNNFKVNSAKKNITIQSKGILFFRSSTALAGQSFPIVEIP
jgi:hypothetical protein